MMSYAHFRFLVIISVGLLAGSVISACGRSLYGAAGPGQAEAQSARPPEVHRFTLDATIPIAGGVYGAIIGDLRKDGVTRIVAGSEGSHSAYVFHRQGGSYVEEWNTLYGDGGNVIPAAVGDVDNDGQNEFLVSVYDTGKIFMYRWNGATYEKVHEQYFGGLYMPAAVGDIDRDGANELIVDGSGVSPLVSVFDYDSASQTFILAWSAPMGHALQIAVGDPDNDGELEAVVPLPWDYPPGKLMIIGCNSGAYSVEATLTSFPLGLCGAAVADFDGDGKNEILTGLFNIASASYPVYLVKHSGAQYDITTVADAGAGTFGIAAGDIDRDGLPEAAVYVNGSGPLVVEFQDPGWRSTFVPIPGGQYGTLADLDGDNRAEILTAAGVVGIVSDTGGQSFLGADIDGVSPEEIVGDLATQGLWYWNGATWVQLSPVEPEGLATANFDGDPALEVAADFGLLGLWIWNGGVWSAITGLNPEGLMAASLDSTSPAALVADLGKAGLWKWEGGAWAQLTGGNAQDMIFADPDGDSVREIVADFGPLGLWRWDGGAWAALSTFDANVLAGALTNITDATEEIFAGFGAYGLWLLKDGLWTQLSGALAEGVVAGRMDALQGEEIVVDFGAAGLWMMANGLWSQLSGLNADFMVAGDVDNDNQAELAADFGSAGLWLWNFGNWNQLSTLNPDCLALANTDAVLDKELVADFGTTGIWLWNNGSWSRIR
jgi:hypothetical protein